MLFLLFEVKSRLFVLPGKCHGKPTDFWLQCSALILSEMLKTWWFAGAAPGLWPPAAHSSRSPAVHYNRAMITPTLLARFSVPPRLSALRFQPSRHVIVPTLLTLSLPASHNLCPSITASHMWQPCHSAAGIILTYLEACIANEDKKKHNNWKGRKRC